MRKEYRKWLFQLSGVLTVSITRLSRCLSHYLPRNVDVFHLHLFFPASIFAYGQTSSGKTYTMMGVTEYTVADIFDYMHRVIKLSNLVLFSSLLSFPIIVFVYKCS